MELTTSRFGLITIQESDIYSFSKGIPGFENQTRFVILAPEADEPFAYLQSVLNGELVFVIADPFLFYSDYEFEIPDSTLAELKVEHTEQVLVRSIITIPGDLENATLNLVAPLIINVEARLGKQIVLGKSSYTTKQPLFKPAVR